MAIRLRPMTLFNRVFHCQTPIVKRRLKTQADEGLGPQPKAGDSSRRSWLCRSASAPSQRACEPVQDRCLGPCSRPGQAAGWRSRNRGALGGHPTPLTILGGLRLELLSGKGLEPALLEGIGLKDETVFCHHGVVLRKTHMQTRTVPWLHSVRLPRRGHQRNGHNAAPSVPSRSPVRCVSLSLRKSGNKSNTPPSSTVAATGHAGRCNPSS